MENGEILADNFEKLLHCEPILEKFEFTPNISVKPDSEPPMTDEIKIFQN